jgi:MFS transporter, PAT family, beta-lactamase induction signal transducer AmpG
MNDSSMSDTTIKQRWLDKLRPYKNPKVLGMLFFGFSAGLPLSILLLGTLTLWLRKAGIERSTITHFAWIGLAYGFKWVWSPLVDRLRLPLLTKSLGLRRAWLLVSQIMILLCLVGLAFSNPVTDLGQIVFFAIVMAFASATQDVAMDAYRIEAVSRDLQPEMASSYQTGYGISRILATAGALAMASWLGADDSQEYLHYPWKITLLLMAGFALVGVFTTLFTQEPEENEGKQVLYSPEELQAFIQKTGYHPTGASVALWLKKTVYEPLADFFVRYKMQALVLLFLISVYRISDIVLGPVAGMFYLDIGFSVKEIASISKVFGVIMVTLGAALGGILCIYFGVVNTLIIGAILMALTNTLFALLATIGHDIVWLAVVIAMDNMSAGIASTAFITYLSSLTNISYTATQYALLTSVAVLLPKFISGFSGNFVDAFGYIPFFLSVSALGIPVVFLLLILRKTLNHPDVGSAESGQSTKT